MIQIIETIRMINRIEIIMIIDTTQVIMIIEVINSRNMHNNQIEIV